MAATCTAAPAGPTRPPAGARRRPGVRTGYTLDFAVGDFTAILTANTRDDGSLREIFIQTGKHGSTLAGLLDTIAAAVSIGLRNGVPLQNYVDHLADVAFIPNGPTDDPDITRATSVTDYLFRRLALDFLRPESRQAAALGKRTSPAGDLHRWANPPDQVIPGQS